MLPPITQEEIDRRESASNRIAYVRDVMDMLGDVEDVTLKLKMVKSLLSNIVTDNEVIQLLQDQIDQMESSEGEDGEGDIGEDEETPSFMGEEPSDEDIDFADDLGFEGSGEVDVPTFDDIGGGEEESDEGLPSPDEMGIDFTDSNNPDLLT